MDFEARIRLKKTKRRGDDPRLDALADELAKDLEREREGREAREPNGTPGMISAGGLSEAKAHVTGLAPPDDLEHATLEMRKVVIERAAERAASEGRTPAAWKAWVIGATILTAMGVGLGVGVWLMGRGRGGEKARAAETAAVLPEKESAAEAMRGGAAPKATGSMGECAASAPKAAAAGTATAPKPATTGAAAPNTSGTANPAEGAVPNGKPTANEAVADPNAAEF